MSGIGASRPQRLVRRLGLIALLLGGCSPSKPPAATFEGAPERPEELPAVSQSKSSLDLYEGRLRSAELVIEPATTTLDARALGADSARAFVAAEQQLEMVLLHFPERFDVKGVVEKVRAAGWPGDQMFDFARSGPVLMVVRTPSTGPAKQFVLDDLLGRFAGEE